MISSASQEEDERVTQEEEKKPLEIYITIREARTEWMVYRKGILNAAHLERIGDRDEERERRTRMKIMWSLNEYRRQG